MLEVLCIPCQHGDHANHHEVVEAAPEGMLGGARCPCSGNCKPAQADDPPAQGRYIDKWPKPMFLCTHCDEQTDSDPCLECAPEFNRRGEDYPRVLRFQVAPMSTRAPSDQIAGLAEADAAKVDAYLEEVQGERTHGPTANSEWIDLCLSRARAVLARDHSTTGDAG